MATKTVSRAELARQRKGLPPTPEHFGGSVEIKESVSLGERTRQMEIRMIVRVRQGAKG